MAAHQIKFMMPRWSIEAINTIYRPVCADPVKRMRPLTMMRSLDMDGNQGVVKKPITIVHQLC